MAKTVELRRHTPNEVDTLTPAGVKMAVEIGRRMRDRIQVAYSSGAQRATQAVGSMVAGHGRAVPGGVVVEPGLRSQNESKWGEVIDQAASEGIAELRAVDPAFIDQEAATLAETLRRIFDRLDDGQRALAVAHSPTNEAAVFGLTGEIVAPLRKGEGVVLVEDDHGEITVTRAR